MARSREKGEKGGGKLGEKSLKGKEGLDSGNGLESL